MKKKILALILMMAMAAPLLAQMQYSVKPRGVSIATLGEGETVYIGALQMSPRRLIAATWVRIYASEAISVTFNGGPVLYEGSNEDVLSGVGNTDYAVTNEIPITANQWHIIKCRSTKLTLTDCDAGSATIIAEYD